MKCPGVSFRNVIYQIINGHISKAKRERCNSTEYRSGVRPKGSALIRVPDENDRDDQIDGTRNIGDYFVANGQSQSTLDMTRHPLPEPTVDDA